MLSVGIQLFLQLAADQVAAKFTDAPTPPVYPVFLPIIAQNAPPVSTPADPPTDARAAWSTPIDISLSTGTIWTVNPDAGSVTAIDGKNLAKLAEVAVGQEPWSVAVAPNGKFVYVTDRASGQVVAINALTYAVVYTMTIGAELGGMALSPSGAYAYITSMATDEVVVVDLETRQIEKRIPVDALPYAVAITDDGDSQDNDERAYVTHLLAQPTPGGREATDSGREGRITVIDVAASAVLTQTLLPPDETGFPNLLTSITLAGDRAWVPYVRAAPDLPNGLTTRVFAAVSAINLADQREEVAAYLPLNDQEIFGSPVNNPVAAIPSPDGKRLYVVLAGSDLIEVVDIAAPHQPQLEKFVAVGMNPRGMVLNQAGSQGYVMNYLARSVSVVDLATLAVTAVITTTTESLTPETLRGKILFNNAVNPKLSQGSWISCASCHPDGGTDGVTWMFPDGPRQTPPIWNAAQTLPWHWSAALDEAQDVEETIHLIQLGLGLAPGTDPAQLGEPNAGRSADLDALAAFMQQGIRPPSLKTAQDVQLGRELFVSTGCVSCHGGATWTTSALPALPGAVDLDGNGMVDSVLRAVGTLNPRDVRGETGFDIPALVGARMTAPYLHDGSLPTLAALLRSGHPDPQGEGNPLSRDEIVNLVQFLQSIDPHTTPINAP